MISATSVYVLVTVLASIEARTVSGVTKIASVSNAVAAIERRRSMRALMIIGFPLRPSGILPAAGGK